MEERIYNADVVIIPTQNDLRNLFLFYCHKKLKGPRKQLWNNEICLSMSDKYFLTSNFCQITLIISGTNHYN